MISAPWYLVRTWEVVTGLPPVHFGRVEWFDRRYLVNIKIGEFVFRFGELKGELSGSPVPYRPEEIIT